MPTTIPAPEEPSATGFRDPAIAADLSALLNWIRKKRGLIPGASVLYALLLSYAWQSDRCWHCRAHLAVDLEVTAPYAPGVLRLRRMVCSPSNNVA